MRNLMLIFSVCSLFCCNSRDASYDNDFIDSCNDGFRADFSKYLMYTHYGAYKNIFVNEKSNDTVIEHMPQSELKRFFSGEVDSLLYTFVPYKSGYWYITSLGYGPYMFESDSTERLVISYKFNDSCQPLYETLGTSRFYYTDSLQLKFIADSTEIVVCDSSSCHSDLISIRQTIGSINPYKMIQRNLKYDQPKEDK